MENQEVVFNFDHHSLQDSKVFGSPIYDEYHDLDDNLHEQHVVFYSSEFSNQPICDEEVLTPIFDQEDQFSFHPTLVTKSHTETII